MTQETSKAIDARSSSASRNLDVMHILMSQLPNHHFGFLCSTPTHPTHLAYIPMLKFGMSNGAYLALKQL